MGKRLITAVDALAEYFGGTGRTDLLNYALGKHTDVIEQGEGGNFFTGMKTAGITPGQRELAMILLDNVEGARFIRDIVKEYKSFTPKSKEKEPVKESDIFDPVSIRIVHEPELIGLASADRKKCIIENASVKEMCGSYIDESGWEDIAEGVKPEGWKNAEINKAPTEQPEALEKPSLVGITFPNVRVGLPNRDMDAASLFCNAIHPLEYSKASPFINVRFIFPGSERINISTDESGISTGEKSGDQNMTLLSFLRAGGGESGAGDKAGMGAVVYGDEDPLELLMGSAGAGNQVTQAGQELFGAPQTMLNMTREGFPSDDSILYKTRPFMSLQDLTVNITSAGRALLASKKATLKIRLHDKSRLKEISPLVSPSEFARTKVLIEFGWEHPEGSLMSNNPMGQLINNLRDKGLYNLVSSNYTLTPQGEVDVTLNLACSGYDECKSIPIATGDHIPASIFKNQLDIVAAQALKSVTDSVNPSPKMLREMKISTNNSRASGNMIKIENYEKILKTASSIANPSDTDAKKTVEDLLKEMDEFFNIEKELKLITKEKSNWTNKELKERRKSKLSSLIKSRLEGIMPRNKDSAEKKSIPQSDPFLKHVAGEIDEEALLAIGEYPDTAISMGKLIMAFVGYPLAATRKFDEVQVMFYPFNNHAAGARKYTTASFPIPFPIFETEFGAAVTGEGANPKMTVSQFLNFLEKYFVKDLTNPVYGVKESIEKRKKAIEEAKKEFENDKDGKAEALQNAKDVFEEDLMRMYLDDGMGPCEPKFTPPNLEIAFEAMPAIVPEDPERSITEEKVDESKTILRIHIYDSKACPNPTQLFLLKILEGSEIATRVKGKSKSESEISKYFDAKGNSGALPVSEAVLLADAGVTVDNISDSLESYTGGRSASFLKGILRSTMPNIIVGSSNTPVLNISVGSSTSGAAQKVFLLNAIGKGGNPQGGKGDSNPLDDMTVIPANLSLNMLGCPLFTRGNQIFIDLETGTSLDNVYGIKNVTHTISQGNFQTSLQCAFISSGDIKALRSKISTAKKAIQKAQIAAGSPGSTLLK